MRVLGIFNTDNVLGGGEISFTLSLRSLIEKGCTVLAVVTDKGPLWEYLGQQEIPAEIADQPSLRKDLHIRYLVQPQPKLLGIARDFRPDIIHCNAVRSALYGQAVARRLERPAVMHARKTEKDGVIDSFLMATLDAVICTSHEVRHRFPRWPNRAKLPVLYNPVDIPLYERPSPEASLLRKEWLGGADLLVGVPGRLSPIKGQHLVVEAAPHVLRHAPLTRFVFVGSEDLSFPGFQAALQQRIRELGLTEHFTFVPWIKDPVAIYQALDVIAFPTSSEGFGRVIIEAGAARKALITSDIPVVKEVIGPELEDLTVHCDAAGPLAQRITDLLTDPGLRHSVAERLHNRVRENFGIAAHSQRLCEVYRQLISMR
jgi:glycosyltransferase involved in cell wall biosynthesis